MEDSNWNSTVTGLAEAIILAGLASGRENAQAFIDNLRHSALQNDPQAQRVMFIIAGRAQERLDAWNRVTAPESPPR